jgi:hypothetical protein
LFNAVIGIEQLKELVEEHGSLFVFGGRGRWFWSRGINAYPFSEGALVMLGDDDERRWPGAFLTAIAEDTFTLHADLPVDRGEAFRERWHAHLSGIVEYSPMPVTLPPWAFPPA